MSTRDELESQLEDLEHLLGRIEENQINLDCLEEASPSDIGSHVSQASTSLDRAHAECVNEINRLREEISYEDSRGDLCACCGRYHL